MCPPISHVESDNRIPALASDSSVYTFAAPTPGGEVRVMARLVFRRAYQPVMDEKEWNSLDILMEEESIIFNTQSYFYVFIPMMRADY
jgi:hypothetical protein